MDLVFGIDVASQEFVNFNAEQGHTSWQNNKLRPVRAFLKTLPKGAILAVEATGGYGKMPADEAVAKGFTVFIVQPLKVRRFRQAAPDVRGKTDRIDAKAIHDYVELYQSKLHAYVPLPEFEAQLRKLARTRDGLVRKAASIRLTLRSLGDSPKQIETTLKGLARRIEQINEQIEKLIDSSEDAKVLSTIPGVKTAVIAAVLPALRTIAFKDKYALDSYAGMDLRPNESGKFKGRRYISKQGDKYIRRALFMAAFSGIRSKAWRDHYRSLIEDKKLAKVAAINALARKILHTIFGVYRSQKKFSLQSGG
jgi:transposase